MSFLINHGRGVRRGLRGGGPSLVLVLLAGCVQNKPEDQSWATNSGAATNDGAVGPGGGGAGGNQPGGSHAGSSPVVDLPGNCVDRWEPGKTYHPAGYGDSALHGLDSKLQADKCQNCHGETLEGCGGALSCNNCHDGGHPDGWRENCTYCHGGVENDTGAPPTDLDRATDVTSISFTAHTKHVTGGTHPAYDCNQCHDKPVDVLSAGHMFDPTAGAAEVTFTAGLSPSGKYEGTGSASCSSMYCHGSGLAPGDYAVSKGATTCDTCHGTKDLKRLTYDHDRHTNSIRKFDAITCGSCHPNADKMDNIIDGSTHVDGKLDIKIEGVTYDPASKTCSGTCHTSYPHTNAKWEEKGGGLFGF